VTSLGLLKIKLQPDAVVPICNFSYLGGGNRISWFDANKDKAHYPSSKKKKKPGLEEV
jgi:hypothetical protein